MAGATPQRDPAAGRLLAAGLGGAAISLALGLYSTVHEPANDLAITLGFQTTIAMKVWLATGSVLFAAFQLVTALWMFGRLPLGSAPSWLGTAHRISGRLAFLFSIPVAYHCLYMLGFQEASLRTFAHSLAGCAFYGAFVVKVLVVRSRTLPGAALPLAGGLIFSLLVLAWLTSGLWYITDTGFPSP